MREKILILCVNYNSYKELYNYLNSINTAATKVLHELNVDVMIADNTTANFENIDTEKYISINVKPFAFHENLGYLGGISRIIKANPSLNFNEYIYVIISNVDIILPPDFFEKLIPYKRDEKVAWIAPKIISYKEKRDRNPKSLKKPSIKHIDELRFLFSHPILFNLYTKTLYKIRKRKTYNSKEQIYAGHGSFMIFSGSFMKKNRRFKFPSFLFCEEIFLAELVRKSGLIVIYEPSIIVNDIDHISTGKLKKTEYCKMHYNSLTEIKYILY
jgi:GT2 family glycosyltransferase